MPLNYNSSYLNWTRIDHEEFDEDDKEDYLYDRAFDYCGEDE